MTDVPPPPAWYADPTGRWEYRFWDGQGWTDHVSRGGVAGTDPPTGSATPAGATSTTAVASAEPKEQGFFGRMREDHQQKTADRTTFENLARAAAHGDEAALAALPRAVEEARALWRSGKFDSIRVGVLVAAIRDVMADDTLTADEEDRIVRTAAALGTEVQSLQTTAPDALEEIVIGKINAGRPPVLSSPPVMLNAGEIAYAAFAVDLMKEVVQREFRGGSQGVSIPLGGGFRYRVGSMRGHSVVVGTQLVPQDSGMLTVTSKRALFTGQKKTLEFRRDRLVGMEQYTDGIRLNVSNRQTASLFKLHPGQSSNVLAALLSTS